MSEVDHDRVLEAAQERRRINRLNLRDEIVFMRDGKTVSVSKERREDFAFTGLSNVDFILIYLGGQDE